MATIGRVYRDSYTKGDKTYPTIVLDIRTITQRKKFTIAVNKHKYQDGNIHGTPAQGKEDHPDFHVWANFSNKGESLPSVIVGNISNAVSENGLKYKRGKLFDPFVQRESIYFTLFEVSEDKRIDESHIYDVVAEAYRKIQNTEGQTYSPSAQPNYDASTSQDEVTVKYEDIPF